MNISLLLDERRLLDSFDVLINRLIEEGMDITGIWYAFGDYVHLRHTGPGDLLAVDANTIQEINDIYLANLLPTPQVGALLEAGRIAQWDAIQTVYQRFADTQQYVVAVDTHARDDWVHPPAVVLEFSGLPLNQPPMR